jgi:hypothetical protein
MGEKDKQTLRRIFRSARMRASKDEAPRTQMYASEDERVASPEWAKKTSKKGYVG